MLKWHELCVLQCKILLTLCPGQKHMEITYAKFQSNKSCILFLADSAGQHCHYVCTRKLFPRPECWLRTQPDVV